MKEDKKFPWDKIPGRDLLKIETGELKISDEILETLTIEELFNNPKLAVVIEKAYPRAYLALTLPVREINLLSFIRLAEGQIKAVEDMANLAPYIDDQKKSLKHGIKVIKLNKLGKKNELWIGGVPFKFELSRFVENYAKEKTYKEWREILKDLRATKSNIERILEKYKSRFKK